MATAIPTNEAAFVLDQIAMSCGGRVHARDASTRVRGVVTDSRAVLAGTLYVALRGEHHDGHAFVAQAQQLGAAAVLVDDMRHVPGDLPAVCVSDTRHALGELALLHRSRWPGKLVAVTGSAGKSTTKELTAAALSALGHKVLRTRGNLNNDIGLPMTLLCLDASHDVAVVEVGTSAPGEIARLARLACADVGVVTSVSLAHTAGLGSLADVADEKCALLRALGAKGVAVYSADSEVLRARVPSFGGARTISFGLHDDANVRLLRHVLSAELTTRCTYRLAGSADALEVNLGLCGIGPALDAGAALAVVLALYGAAALPKAARGLPAVAPLPGRLAPRPTAGGALVIDDTYNANPASMQASLATLVALAHARQGRAIAALGDMAELGVHSQAEHERIGEYAAQLGVAALFVCGAEMTHAARTARVASAALPPGTAPRVQHFMDPVQSAQEIGSFMHARDAVLVKGSRSMLMERVVEALCASAGGAR